MIKRKWNWSVSEIYRLIVAEKIIFNNTNRWNSTTESLFIKSLYQGLPVPILVLESRENKMFCVDGNKRLTALKNHMQKDRCDNCLSKDLIDTLNFEYQLARQTMPAIILYNASEREIQSIKLRLNTW
jgi:hypothetical protein